MSLIDEALKRAQAAGEGERVKTADRPWIPTPMPDAGLARRRLIVRTVGIAFTAGILAGTGLWLIRRELAPTVHPLPAGEGRGVGRVSAAPAAAVPVPTPFPSVEVSPPAGQPQPRPSRVAPAAKEVAADGAPAAAPAPAPAPRPQTIADGKVYAGSVTLAGGAKIELGGIVWSETEPRALLNDRITAVGGYLEGFTVARIEQDRVALEKDGVTIYLSVK